ncbi:MAG: hypothetical protein ABR518_09995 [Actinomycetota bacterium]
MAYFGFVDTPMVRDSLSDRSAAGFVEQIPRWLRRSLTAEQAGEAIARGIERREARIIAPRAWAFMRATRGVSDALADRYIARRRHIIRMVERLDRDHEGPAR